MQYAKAFAAGFFATLVFHQGVLLLLHLSDPSSVPAPFDMTATAPMDIPAVFSLAFWGGVWGIPIWWLIRNAAGWEYWVRAAVLGAIGPSAVAMLIVFPMKDEDVTAKIVVGALILNAAWGIGVAIIMRLLSPGRKTSADF